MASMFATSSPSTAAGRHFGPTVSNLPLWHRRGATGVLLIATGCLLAAFSTHEVDDTVPIYYVASIAAVIALWALIGRSPRKTTLLVWPLAVMVGMAGASTLAPLAAMLCIGSLAVAFLFAGLTQDRGISLIMLPAAIATYLLVYDLPFEQLVVKLTIATLVWIAVSEFPAWLAADLRAAQVEMERLADTDPLTGLANRRYWDEQLPRLLDSTPSSVVLLIDLDHFKNFNDTYGHLAGDEMLIAFARAIEQALPAGSIAARWGGEEFALALSDRVQARTVADTILGTVPLEQTCSIGMAEHRAGESTLEVLKRADDALYSAKSAGRDRIVAA